MLDLYKIEYNRTKYLYNRCGDIIGAELKHIEKISSNYDKIIKEFEKTECKYGYVRLYKYNHEKYDNWELIGISNKAVITELYNLWGGQKNGSKL